MALTLKKLCQNVAPSLLKVRYHGAPVGSTGSSYVVDLRSDVLTQPSDKMKECMMQASLADDVFNEDENVHELQATVAKMFGKEDALFVPSGTMGNFLSVVCQCSHGKGLEVLLGDKSHLVMYEQGGLATVGGVHTRTVPTLPNGTFNLDTVEESIRPMDDPHQPFTAVIGVENTHNVLGGKVLPLEFLAKLKTKVQDSDIKLHMDGARLMNAAVALHLPPKDLVKDVDTVSLCLSKGVGTPVGSVIAGPGDFIQRAVRMRKMLGGGWRKPGMLAAAGLCALEDVEPRMKMDHKHAKILASAIMEHHQDVVHIDLAGVHTNIIMVDITKPGITAQQFCERLNTVSDKEFEETGERILVKAIPFSKHVFRLVTYTGIRESDIQHAIPKLKYVVNEYATECEVPKRATDFAEIKDVPKPQQKCQEYVQWEPLLYNLSYRKGVVTA